MENLVLKVDLTVQKNNMVMMILTLGRVIIGSCEGEGGGGVNNTTVSSME